MGHLESCVLTNAKDKRKSKDHGLRRCTRRGCNGNHASSEYVLFRDRTLRAKTNKMSTPKLFSDTIIGSNIKNEQVSQLKNASIAVSHTTM